MPFGLLLTVMSICMASLELVGFPSSPLANGVLGPRHESFVERERYGARLAQRLRDANALRERITLELKPGHRPEVESPVPDRLMALQQAMLRLQTEEENVERALNHLHAAPAGPWGDLREEIEAIAERFEAAYAKAEQLLDAGDTDDRHAR